MAVKVMNLSPSEFWRMKPRHFWALYKSHLGEQVGGNDLTKGDVKRLRQLVDRSNGKNARNQG